MDVDKSRRNHRPKWWNIIVHWKKRERTESFMFIVEQYFNDSRAKRNKLWEQTDYWRSKNDNEKFEEIFQNTNIDCNNFYKNNIF